MQTLTHYWQKAIQLHFSLQIALLALLLGSIGSMVLYTPVTHAGAVYDPDGVIATTQAIAGPYADCLITIEDAETGGTFSATAFNPRSGAWGPLQFMQYGGIWAEAPLGRSGLAVTAASLVQQISMAVWAIEHGYASAWAGSAPASCYVA